MTKAKKSDRRERCLFINKGQILNKILEGKNFVERYKPVMYDFNMDKRSITEVVKLLSVRVIVIETSEINNFKSEVIKEIVDLRLRGVLVYESEEFYEVINCRVPIVKLQANEYLSDDIFSIKMRRRYRVLKRVFDLLVVFCLAPIAIPLVFIGAIAMALTSKGGMFFSQPRFGMKGKIFKVHKIRTMVVNDGNSYTAINDSRITPIGKFLRLSKIDELPQLFNILKGEMSVIGPRPEMVQYALKTSEENPFYNLRHMIKPGVTGWAQIHIPKANSDDNLKKLEYDLYYIKRYSWQLDYEVIKRTICIVLTLDSK